MLRFHVIRKKVTAFKEDFKKVSHHTRLRKKMKIDVSGELQSLILRASMFAR